MSRFEFFQKILTQLEALQTSVNALRDTVKEEIISTSFPTKEINSK